MAELHPAASHHLPAFIPDADGTDVLMTVMGFILLLSVLMFGILFLRLHSLPERIAHRGHKLQFEIVAVLGLIGLFTHMHIFWIAGLLLALIDLPDFGTSLNRIAGSAEKIAGISPGQGAAEPPLATAETAEEEVKPANKVAHASPATNTGVSKGDGAASRPEIAPTKAKELIHA